MAWNSYSSCYTAYTLGKITLFITSTYTGISMPPVSRINQGLKPLLRDNPWPDFIYGEVRSFELSLDGGGRGGHEIIIDVIKKYDVKLMVEVGCFLGGSAVKWLRAKKDLTLIGVDPWDGNWAAYIETMALDPVRSRTVWHLKEEEIALIVACIRRYGNFCTAMNNLRIYKDRFIPVRRKIPEAFGYLRERLIEPDLVYIDAGKYREDIDTAYEMFPDAIICGDDYLWPDENGVFRMKEAVHSFAEEHNMEVQHKMQTWLLVPHDEISKEKPVD